MYTSPRVALFALLLASAARAAPSPAELGAFIDGVVRGYMTERGIAGVTVSVVAGDGVLYERGYGIASQKPPRNVDAATTLFRIGSISKTFTYVAAMQLVGQHKIDLQADVNAYLPPALQVPDESFGPIRVWNLMTHTAGFEDAGSAHWFRFGEVRVEELDEYLARFRPHRVRAPGLRADYSNYSVALLGALVAHASGEAFEDYVDKHLLLPLGMKHTTFREPLPASDKRHAPPALQFATALRRVAGGYKDELFEHVAQAGPAGAGSSTAHDMTRWMRMLLGGGALEGKQVLGPDAFRELATVNFRNAPDVGGIAHGFFRARYGRYQSLEHGGATLSFFSNLVLLPEAGLGIFVSTDTDTGSALSQALPRLIFERFLPDSQPAALPAAGGDFAERAKRFAGSYLSERRAYTTIEKVFAMPGTVEVGEGALVLISDGKKTRWLPEGPLTFRSADTGDRLQFLEDAAGRITGFASAYGHAVADKVGPVDDPKNLALALGAVVLLSIGVIVGAWARRGRALGPYSRAARWGALLIAAASIAWLGFLGAAAAVAARFLSGDLAAALASYPPALLRAAVGLGWAAAVLAAAALVLHLGGWRSAGWPAGRLVRHSLVLLVMLAAAALLVRHNVLLAPYTLGG